MKAVPPKTPVGVLNTAGQLFAVAQPLLEGRIATAAGDRAKAIADYRASAKAQDALTYDEPPSWYYPVRETLGAALLAAGKAAEAEAVFRDDLRYNPRNGRSLFGAWKSLEGQGKKAAAARARVEFERVWAVSLIRFRGHFPKGGYDVQNGIKEDGPAATAAVHGRVHGRRGPARVG